MRRLTIALLLLCSAALIVVGCKAKSSGGAGGGSPAAPGARPEPPPPGTAPGKAAPAPADPGAPAGGEDEGGDEPDDDKPAPPPPDREQKREKWEVDLEGRSDKEWKLLPGEIARSLKLGIPEAKLREKIVYAIEEGVIKAPMKATEAEQEALLKAGASKELVHFLMNLPVD